jgi:predicted enzyme related to lactoylglutathione lyase
MNLNSIMIGSEDPKRLADYYAKLFGAPGMEDGGYSGWEIGNGWVTVGPHDQVKGSNPEPGRVIWNIESSDVPGDFERLTAAGATTVQEPYHPEGASEMWIATFSDPDDNYFQLMSSM